MHQQGSAEKSGRNGFSIAGMICGIMGIPTCFVFVGLLPGILGIIFGILGLRSQYKGMAIAGIVCGAIAVILVILWFLFAVYGFWILDTYYPPIGPEIIPNYLENQTF